MTKEKHSAHVAVIMPYHNNLYDFLSILSEIGTAYVITPRSYQKATHVKPPVPIRKIHSTRRIGPITHAYNPLKLWKMIDSTTTHVIVKHIDAIENIIPILIAKAKGAQIIIMVQQVQTPPHREILTRCIARFLRSMNIRVFSVTHSGKIALQKILPGITYIPANINPERFMMAPISHQEVAELQILSIGKYIPRKNFTTLIRAMQSIREKYPSIPIRLTLVGPIGDLRTYEKVVRLVKDSPKLHHTVSIQTDTPANQIPSILANHNLFILPAKREPLGYAVLEAMASGLPVITTQEVGSASYVENGKNGFILKNITPKAIENAVLAFIKPDKVTVDIHKLKEFGQHSRTLVEKHHTANATKKSIKNLLE